eukprot:gnl/MRDRNA2_/MRDRNA2_95312_c0_seq1.p1 gnl/MRDRNA2_/MRDRNA2_95312_c0~~gnl/MRDRNA2_/MRDRNA2_95312_c0_seq1.p1  ORF type:complete len:121 (-),score=18.68 gnl/MRDRNA2_/MRDRNA2_95312_c0_seq1:86-448(-)
MMGVRHLCIMLFSTALVEALQTRWNRKRYTEDTIITSLNNCPMCRGKEPCLMDCREKDGKPWDVCLKQCLGDNPLLLDTFTSIISDQEGGLSSFGGAQVQDNSALQVDSEKASTLEEKDF